MIMDIETCENILVVYLRPRRFLFGSRESVAPVTTRDHQRQAQDAPKDAYAFYYLHTQWQTAQFEGGEVTATMISQSPRFFIDAEGIELNDVLCKLPRKVAERIHRQGGHAVLCRTGNIEVFDPAADTIVSAES